MASTEAPEPLDSALIKVRRLKESNLPHQSKPAQLLIAIESSLQSTLPSASSSAVTAYTSTAYFSALLQCLEKAINDEVGDDEDMAEAENMGQGALIPATLYLLTIVVPETPAQVVLSKLSPLLECLLPLYDTALEHPPALRSLLQITTSLLLFATAPILSSSPLLKKAWNFLLELNLDPRPKVRHLAQEGVRKVLTTPVPPKITAGSHPYLPRAREWVTSHLEEEARNSGSSSKGKKARFADAEEGEGKMVIWIVQGLRGWVAVWGDEQLSSLCSHLLSLPPLPHLTPQIYSLLAHLLTPPPTEVGVQPSVLQNLPTIIESLLASPPEVKANSTDLSTYLPALTSALIKMSIQDPLSLPAFLPKAFNLVFNNVLLAPSVSQTCLAAATESIGSQGIIRYCVTDEMIFAAIDYKRQGSLEPGARKKQKTPFVTKVIGAVTEAMNSHALRMPLLLPILTALVSRLRIDVTTEGPAALDLSGNGITGAEELLLDLVKEVGDLRTQKGFEEKAKVDEVVGMAIEVMGVEAVLKVLPLNIEPDASGVTPFPGRAHLLPMIRQKVTNDSLVFFTSYFRPMSERLFAKKVAAEDAGREAEAKVWEVVVGQIWDCFPGFCEMPRDLRAGLTTPFLTLLTNLLYTQPSLLTPLLRGLTQLVSSNQRLVNSATESVQLRKQFGLDQAAAKENLSHLKTLAKDMVSVLLNVFSKLPREQRGPVGDVIGAWVGIMTEQDVIGVYQTVTTHLSSNLTSTQPSALGASPISHTMLDLLIIFVPYLPQTQSSALFTATATATMLEHHDATVQKKSYRLLKQLLAAGRLGATGQGEKLDQFVVKIGEAGAGIGPGAQRDRLQLLAAIVDVLPRDRLHLIPELLSEAVLGTKEVNERARDAGFDLVVAMGHKMAKGGVVKQQVPISEDDEEGMQEGEADANVEEFITMVAAGLTGTTPHMISASLNALSRLIFEFKDEVSEQTLSELVETTAVFLGSKNREIVKSALGFIKLLTITIDPTIITPYLPSLVPALLGWVHDHKNHFKQKTVHIFERMIRRFGYDEVYRHAPEGGERKVLEGIKKRKERAKKKKARAAEEGSDDEPAVKTSSGNAFEDVLYNSDTESEAEDDEDGVSNGRPTKAIPKGKGGKGQQAQAGRENEHRRDRSQNQTYIRDEGDEPMDLLSRSIAGGVTSTDPNAKSRARKPGQDAGHFKTDRYGKLVFAEDDAAESAAPTAAQSLEGTAFMTASHGVDGATRDARGNLKFNKNTKRSRLEDEMMDIDEPVRAAAPEKKKRKEGSKRLGEEFRAKRAGGDIKRQGGPDPFSYVPIGQAAQKHRGNKVNLTNKKKGSRS